jgi:iron complex transport system substrate-binding protein
MRVMSVNQCADQLVMALLPPERIASITYLSQRGSATPELTARARRLKANHGLTEEALSAGPDLIVAGRFTTGTLKRLARRSGVAVIELDPADDFPAIRSQTLALGAALGEPGRARALVRRMDRTLAELKRTAPARPILAVGWNGGGRVSGRGSLFDAILTAAGGVNPAAAPDAFERSLDLEQLLSLNPRPDLLLYGMVAGASVAPVDGPRHPALARAYGGRRLAYRQDAYLCGTPFAADEAVALRASMLKALHRR